MSSLWSKRNLPNRLVTLGKGLALRIASVGLGLEASGSDLNWLWHFRVWLHFGATVHG